MRIFMIGALALGLATPAFAGDATPQSLPQTQSRPLAQSQPQQKPVGGMDRLLRALRDLDSSQDMQGDHVVGELLC